jgi:hypothetical protein
VSSLPRERDCRFSRSKLTETSANLNIVTSSGFELTIKSIIDQWVCLEDKGGRRIWVVSVVETSFGWYLHCCFVHECFSDEDVDMLIDGYKNLEINDLGVSLFEMLSLT